MTSFSLTPASYNPDPTPRRPYTATGASVRTSLTWVDHTAEESMPTLDEISNIAAAQHEVAAAVPQTLQTSVTFLLVSGRRRTMLFDPESTIGRVKELVWNAWLSDWQDERPPAPSYLRILYLGKMLQDDDTLTKLGLPSYIPTSTSSTTLSQNANVNANTPPTTIVHLSIRLRDSPTEDEGPQKKGRCRVRNGDGGGEGGGQGEETGSWCGCCCVIC